MTHTHDVKVPTCTTPSSLFFGGCIWPDGWSMVHYLSTMKLIAIPAGDEITKTSVKDLILIRLTGPKQHHRSQWMTTPHHEKQSDDNNGHMGKRVDFHYNLWRWINNTHLPHSKQVPCTSLFSLSSIYSLNTNPLYHVIKSKIWRWLESLEQLQKNIVHEDTSIRSEWIAREL